MSMNMQPNPHSAWRWIIIVAALIFVAIVAWRVNAYAKHPSFRSRP